MDYDKYINKLDYVRSKVDKEAYIRYNEEDLRLKKLFKSDLEEEYNITGNPKAQALFEKAWSYGHSAGLREVEAHYSELVELIL